MHIRVHMVKPVSLSDPAFAALRREKREGESDSDVVLRVIREAMRARKDPDRFLDHDPELRWTWEEHLEFLERMDKADRRRARGR